MLLTKKGISDYLLVSTRTIDRYVKSGMPVLKFGGSIRFEVEDVMKWIKEQNEKEKEIK